MTDYSSKLNHGNIDIFEMEGMPSNSAYNGYSKVPNGMEIDTDNAGSYKDGEIIPWRKLYTKKRDDDIQLGTELGSSKALKFFIKFNQWPILVISSVCVAILTIFLDWSITWINDIKYGYCKSDYLNVRQSCGTENWHHYSSFIQLLMVILISTILAIVCAKFSNSVILARSGINELKMIITGYVNNKFLDAWIIVRKFVLLILACSSGGLLLGYEGPLIHISCGVVYLFVNASSKYLNCFKNLNNEAVKREMISIGFAIGISLAFGAPIGGVLFAVENLKFSNKTIQLIWTGFVCSSIATFIFFNFHPFKKIIINDAFTVDFRNGWIFIEALPYIIVGSTCGFLAILFNKFHLKIIEFKEGIKNTRMLSSKMVNYIVANPLIEISILVILVNLLEYPLHFSYLTLNETMVSLFYDCNVESKNYFQQAMCLSDDASTSAELIPLLFYFFIIFFASNYSYSLNVPGGILLPSLTIGAVIGRIIGKIVELIQLHSGAQMFQQCFEQNKNCVSPGSYAMVGAASFFAGITNTSVAAVVIVFELTGAITYLIPLMLGVAMSKTIVDVFNKKSFYDMWIMKLHPNYLTSGLIEKGLISKFTKIKMIDVIDNYQPQILFVEDDLLALDELISKLENINVSNNSSDIINDGFVLLKNRYTPILVGWISFNEVAKAIKDSSENKNITHVSFSSPVQEPIYNNILSLDPFVIRKKDLFIVNPQFSLFSAYELMDQMLITNVFICQNKSSGQEFRGILRISDLAKLVQHI